MVPEGVRLMKVRLFIALLALCGARLLAQAPSSSPAMQPHSSDLGFTYNIPADWQVVPTPTLTDAQREAAKAAATDDEKKGISCVQIALNARHGDPASMVVIVALPFDCFGQQMSEDDLPGFASGASQGLDQNFNVSDPVYGDYKLGSHSMWIERTKGTPKNRPELKYTVEIACTLLKKGAVCWMAMAADDATLQTFEHGLVTLENDAPKALVPADAFAKRPPAVSP
jgi:hypothetical protein